MAGSEQRSHFVESTVLRSMIHGSRAYKLYFDSIFRDDPCVISRFVVMEFRRSFIRSIIGFYFFLRVPAVETIGDALTAWANRFKTSELKAVLQLIGQLLDTERLSHNKPQDLERAKLAIGRYLRRVDLKMRRRFQLAARDSVECARAKVPFKINPATLAEDLEEFLDAFDNKEDCRKKCQIGSFIAQQCREEIEGFIEKACLLKSNPQTRAFKKIARSLSGVLEKGPALCTCARCMTIGDAVIALDAEREMILEHTDLSFCCLCPPLGQSHRLHPSEIRFLTDPPKSASKVHHFGGE